MTTTDPISTRTAARTRRGATGPRRAHRLTPSVVVGVVAAVVLTFVVSIGAAVSVVDGDLSELPGLSQLLTGAPASPRVAELAADAAAAEEAVEDVVRDLAGERHHRAGHTDAD